ncbi:hypothetical protein D1007_51353 [Hordeum vulgare]|nr:hypothetical protein D1007_51353 [Hordeum vulgare]
MNSNNKWNPNPNSFPKDIGWRDLFLGCSLIDRTKFENTIKACSNFSNMEELHKELDTVMKKATPKEYNGGMSVDILHWAMNHTDFSKVGQRAKLAKYRQY